MVQKIGKISTIRVIATREFHGPLPIAQRAWWQPLIAQVLAGKSKAIPLLRGSLQLSKITKKNNHMPYNMRCWKWVSFSTHFWHLFRKCAFTQINSISEIQSISCLILASNSSTMWGFAIFMYAGTWKIKCMQWIPAH